MNNIITLNNISSLLAARINLSPDLARQLIEGIIGEISKRLTYPGAVVSLPGIGDFSVNEGNVIFTPDKMLAEAVNEPFALFETVDIAPGLTEEQLDVTQITDSHSVEQTPETDTPVEHSEDFPYTNTGDEPLETPEGEEPLTLEEEAYIPQEDSSDIQDYAYTEQLDANKQEFDDPQDSLQQEESGEAPNYYPDPTTPRGIRPIYTYLLGLITGIIISTVVGWLIWPKSSNIVNSASEFVEETTSDDIIDNTPTSASERTADFATEQEPMEPSSITQESSATTNEISIPEQPATPIYDTVKAGYFLTKMAKKHYGVEEFWVYIYEENKDIIKNPNQLPAGFRVVIPPASKYGIDPTDPTSVERAKNRSHELNKQFLK